VEFRRIGCDHRGGVGEPGVAHRVGGHFQGQPVGHVCFAKRAAGHAKPHTIELVALKHARLGRDNRLGRPGRVVLQAQTLRGQSPEGSTLAEYILPEFSRRLSVRISTGHADQRNRVRHEIDLLMPKGFGRELLLPPRGDACPKKTA